VTSNPIAEWIADQITDAFRGNQAPQHLIRDRDATFGPAYTRRIHAMGIRDHRHLDPRSHVRICVNDCDFLLSERCLLLALFNRSGAGQKLQQVAVGILKIDAPPATPVIDLHILLREGTAPVWNTGLFDPAEDCVELRVAPPEKRGGASRSGLNCRNPA
jgi:hypothetical protein